jgi:hypothetical protein
MLKEVIIQWLNILFAIRQLFNDYLCSKIGDDESCEWRLQNDSYIFKWFLMIFLLNYFVFML